MQDSKERNEQTTAAAGQQLPVVPQTDDTKPPVVFPGDNDDYGAAKVTPLPVPRWL